MPKIVIESVPEFKPFVAAVEAVVACVERLRGVAQSGGPVKYAAFEAELAAKVAGIERAGHLAALSALEVNAPKVTIGGVPHSRVGHSETTFKTAAGPVVLTRALYRKDGERNARVVDAVSLRAGTVGDGWLPRTARAMAHLLQQGTSREAAQTAAELGRLPYSRCSFERIGHEVGRLYAERQDEIEEALIEAAEIPPEARSISVSLDRVSLPMEEPRARTVGRPRKNAPRRPISRVYRMAYCATITLHDEESEALQTIRYGRMPAADAAKLCEGLAHDVLGLLRQRPDLELSLLADGAPEMWNLLEAELNAAMLGGKEVHRLIDLWHLLEKLAAAARVIHGEAPAGAEVARWRMRLLNSSKAAATILGELVGSGKEHVRVGENQPVHEAITYLTNNGERMNYAAARRAGRPIGSGNVEATCKSLVAQRMKRSGARWKETTGGEILNLRALALSDRWDSGMVLTLELKAPEIRRAA